MKGQRCHWTIFSAVLSVLAFGIVMHPARPTTVEAQTGADSFKVWMKVSPCTVTRSNWLTVSARDPTTGGGGNYYTRFPQSGNYSTFAAASEAAAALAVAPGTYGSGGSTGDYPKFSNYCCRDYRVFRSQATNTFIVVGKFGNPGGGFEFEKGGLCCEEAFDWAGLPATECPASGGGGGGSFGSLQIDIYLSGTTLTYYPRPTIDQCKSDCANNRNCKGFTWIKAGTYKPRDAAMCYLLSAITGQSSGAGHISAVKGSSSSSGSQTLDLAGTWVHLKTEPNNFYYRYTMVLRSAGAKTWNGKITMDTNHQPGDTVGYTISHLRLFEGAVTVTLSAGNKISLRLRRNVAGAPDLQEMGDLLDNNSTIATGTFRFTRK